MRRALPLGILAAFVIVSQSSAQNLAGGQDFTGAYAGVNADYGLERGRDARKQIPFSDRDVAATSSNDLPPSASVAVKSLRPAPLAPLR